MFEVLQNGEHKVATAYGVSKSTYGGRKRIRKGKQPVQAIGQGNGAGASAFVMLSSTMIGVMRRKGFGALYVACLSLIQLTMVCFMFVDDSDIQNTAVSTEERGEDLMEKAQLSLDCWTGTLEATGGAINPDKSYWYLLDFTWQGTSWRYRTQEEMPASLYAKNPDGETCQLRRLDADEAEKTLGVKLAADGNMEEEIVYLKEKATAFAYQVSCNSPANKNDAWIAYSHTIQKTMHYPMPGTTIELKDWDEIYWIVNKATLPKAGYVRTFPHAVLYGPKKYQGTGTPHPYYTQELTHLQDFVGEVNRGTTCGKRIQITTEQLRMETGHPGPFTDVPYESMCQCTTDAWIKTLWKSCQEFGISIDDPFGNLQLARKEDQFLMVAFVNKNYSPRKLRSLNLCRMFLKAVTLADICTMRGDRISMAAYNGHREDQTIHNYRWPRLPPYLPEILWTEWQKALDECFIRTGSREKRIQKELGEWLVDPTDNWHWHFDQETGTLFHKEDDQFRTYQTPRLTRKASQAAVFHPGPLATHIPQEAQLATIVPGSEGGVILLGHSSHAPALPFATPTSGMNPTDTLKAQSNSLKEADQWAATNLKCEDEGVTIAGTIRQGTAIAVSDGSYGAGFSTSGFVLTSRKKGTPSKVHPVTGSNIVPGSSEDHDSYRAELGGVMGVVVTLALICSLHNVLSGSIEIGLDGEEAMKSIFAEGEPKVDASAYDMITDIRRKLRSLPIVVTGRHIKGHQDKEVHRSNLDRWANLNIDMDEKAKALLARVLIKKQPVPNKTFGNETVTVRYKGQKLSRIHKDQLYTEIYGEKTKAFWIKHHAIPAQLIDTIHWEAQHRAFDREPHGKNRWLCKHLAEECGVGICMLRRKHQKHDRCPRCNAAKEGVSHVLTCPAKSAILKWNEATQHLDDWMAAKYTSQQLSDAILTRLHEWRFGTAFSKIIGPRRLKNIIAAQDAIGWENFLGGRVTKDMAEYQQVHYTRIRRRNTGDAWMSKLINQLWLVMFKMWDHRNKVNNTTVTKKQVEDLKQLRFQVRHEFSLGTTGLGPLDQHLLEDRQEIMGYDLQRTQEWLKRITNTRSCMIRTAARLRDKMKYSRRLMSRWLQTANHPPTPQAALPPTVPVTGHNTADPLSVHQQDTRSPPS